MKRGGIVPSRLLLLVRIRELEDRIRVLESPAEAAKIVIGALEQLDLPDTARAVREIFGEDPV